MNLSHIWLPSFPSQNQLMLHHARQHEESVDPSHQLNIEVGKVEYFCGWWGRERKVLGNPFHFSLLCYYQFLNCFLLFCFIFLFCYRWWSNSAVAIFAWAHHWSSILPADQVDTWWGLWVQDPATHDCGQDVGEKEKQTNNELWET